MKTFLKISFTIMLVAIFTPNSFSQLSGSYTIGNGGDFATINIAVSALVTNGVNGAVVFNILTGTYDEFITIDSIQGVSSINVTFQSQTGNRNDVILHTSASLFL
jgi:pectin methylesterase-like acyl-CoA thioesterase